MLADMSRKSDMNNVARKIEYPDLRLERRGGGGEWWEKVLIWPFNRKRSPVQIEPFRQEAYLFAG